MTKKELVNGVSDLLDMTKKDSETVVNAVLDTMKNGVVKDGKLQITDLFTIDVKEMPARKGRNPKTGEEIDIAARRQLYAKFGKGFKDAVQ